VSKIADELSFDNPEKVWYPVQLVGQKSSIQERLYEGQVDAYASSPCGRRGLQDPALSSGRPFREIEGGRDLKEQGIPSFESAPGLGLCAERPRDGDNLSGSGSPPPVKQGFRLTGYSSDHSALSPQFVNGGHQRRVVCDDR